MRATLRYSSARRREPCGGAYRLLWSGWARQAAMLAAWASFAAAPMNRTVMTGSSALFRKPAVTRELYRQTKSAREGL